MARLEKLREEFEQISADMESALGELREKVEELEEMELEGLNEATREAIDQLGTLFDFEGGFETGAYTLSEDVQGSLPVRLAICAAYKALIQLEEEIDAEVILPDK